MAEKKTEREWKDMLSRMGIKRETYMSKVSERCMVCFRDIPWSIQRYEKRGNTCVMCEKTINYSLFPKQQRDYRKMPGRVKKREPIRKVPVVQYTDEQMQEMREEAHG